MVIIVPFLWVRGMALFPFILLKYREDRRNPVLLNHERIHHRQQLEMLILPFYLWYLTEYLLGRFRYKGHYSAYWNISFEREAYANEKDLTYLQRRRPFRFLKFIR